MTEIRKLQEYLAGESQVNDTFMYLENDGVRYVYMPTYGEINLYEDYMRKADIVGLIIGGSFYSINYRFKDVEKDFWTELEDFRSVYDKMYKEKLSLFSVDSPVPITSVSGDYDPVKEKKDLEHYADYQVKRDAWSLFFFNSVPGEYSKVYHEYITPFLKYLVYGEEYLNQFIKDTILENAVHINYRLRVMKMLDDAVRELREDRDMMRRKALYDKLLEKDGATYRITITHRIFPAISISVPVSELTGIVTSPGRSLSVYSLTKADRAQTIGFGEIKFDSISKITYGRAVLYEKEKGVI